MMWRTRKTFIDNIAALLNAYGDFNVILVIEPDSLGNLVMNLKLQKCANPRQLKMSVPTVIMYLDADHAGQLEYSTRPYNNSSWRPKQHQPRHLNYL